MNGKAGKLRVINWGNSKLRVNLNLFLKEKGWGIKFYFLFVTAEKLNLGWYQ